MNDSQDWRGRFVIDSDGDKIGRVEEVYPDGTGNPEWAIVDTGLFGTMSSFVPLAGATAAGEDVQVPFSKEHVKNAPGVSRDGELSESEEAQLYSHYGLRGS
jgi:hypothetical protein